MRTIHFEGVTEKRVREEFEKEQDNNKKLFEVDNDKISPNLNQLKVLLEKDKSDEVLDRLMDLIPDIEKEIEEEEAEPEIAAFDAETGAPLGVTRFKKKEENTIDPLVELLEGLSRKEIIENCMYDLNFFSKFINPDIHKHDYPPLIIAMWKMLVLGLMDLEEFVGQAKYALGIPRGFIKTTVFIKLFSIYCQIFSSKNFVLVIGNTEPNATNILKDVYDMMTTPQFKTIFGDIEQGIITNRKELLRFYLNGKVCVYIAKGILGSARGLSIGGLRPSVVLPDDMQSEENAASPAESQAAITWWSSTIMPAVAPEGSILVYVGNTFAYDGTILNYLIKDKAWVSLTLGAILSDGTSLWEELMPINMLLEAFRSALVVGRDTQWLAQMMNATDISHNNDFNVEKVISLYADNFLDSDGNKLDVGVDHSWIMIDPSSQRKTADDVSIIRTVEDKLGRVVTTHSLQDKMDPEENILKALGLAIQTETPLICIEDVAYQKTLEFWFKKYIDQLKLDWISVIGYNPGKLDKNARIMLDFRRLSKGEHFISREVMEAHYKIQAGRFNKLKKNNKDDILDNVASSYSFHLLNRPSIKRTYEQNNLRRMLKLEDQLKNKSHKHRRLPV